ncbi:uncharacterized protein IWZ02DRAFT_256565 [Phyllosticta citriasiana]|uniref:uncharacterized protein n=1 Tax=Phyllosticta citriasiana TaxID=595635 RepID=UPI0030FDC7DF
MPHKGTQMLQRLLLDSRDPELCSCSARLGHSCCNLVHIRRATATEMATPHWTQLGHFHFHCSFQGLAIEASCRGYPLIPLLRKFDQPSNHFTGLSQSKWLWFSQPKKLSDLELFDQASRGPWGSTCLIFDSMIKWRTFHLAAFGALLSP